ncbi:MAG: hypothetical protein KDA24_08655 [Deltaproteobacteria bacterium]|nr:hypothetical protein [Deltaproteobacteria bacterium]
MAWSPPLRRMFDRSIGVALDRQSWLANRIGDATWGFDMATGLMRFDDPKTGAVITTACQVLGTESAETETWLWAWANEASGIPTSLIETARALGQVGSERGVPEFSAPSLDLADVDGHTLAVVASAAHAVAGYYRAPYDGGALYVLLSGPELVEEAPPPPMIRFVTGWARVNSAVPDQLSEPRVALAAYAQHLGLETTDLTADIVEVRGRGGAARVHLDALGRTMQIEASAAP